MLAITTQRRLKQLEGGGPSDPCGYCGGGGDDPDEPYEIVFVDEAEEEWFEKCGRELITTIYFDDDPRAPWNATVDPVDP